MYRHDTDIHTFIIYIHVSDKTHAPPIPYTYRLFIPHIRPLCRHTHTHTEHYLHGCTAAAAAPSAAACSFIQIVCFQKEYPPSHTLFLTTSKLNISCCSSLQT